MAVVVAPGNLFVHLVALKSWVPSDEQKKKKPEDVKFMWEKLIFLEITQK